MRLVRANSRCDRGCRARDTSDQKIDGALFNIGRDLARLPGAFAIPGARLSTVLTVGFLGHRHTAHHEVY